MALEPCPEESSSGREGRAGAGERGEWEFRGPPEGLKPQRSRWMSPAALVLGGRRGRLTCVDRSAAAGSGGEGGEGWRGAGIACASEVEVAPGEAGALNSQASSGAVAGKAAEQRAFKGALAFLGIPPANGRRPGRKREGGQSGLLSPPPAAWRATFQLESEGGGGRGLGALELLRKVGARPRSLGAHGLGARALAPRGLGVISEHPGQGRGWGDHPGGPAGWGRGFRVSWSHGMPG